MKSSKYWEEAALRREIAVQEGATVTAKELLRLYDEALDDIEQEIRTIKRNFQLRYGIDNETAEYFLSRAQREGNLEKLIEALDVAPDAAAREKILEYIHRDGLSVRAYSARIERYRAVKDTIYARIKNIAAKGIPLFEKMLTDAYKESYYGNIDDYAKGMNVGVNFAILNDRAVKEAVNTPWEGARFSERIWKHTDDLASKAQDLITKAIMSGESLTKTGQKLQAEFGVEKYRAMTLVRTETAHAHNKADLKAYEDLGEEEYKYLATLDYKTCETCQPLDGKVFKLSEAREGINYPVMHPNCRCTTTVNMKYTNRRARNPLTGKSEVIDGDVTYSEWVKNMTPEQRQALELSRKKDSNRVADKLQFERYKKVLGTKEVGRSFDKFQEMKYNEPEKWEDLKYYYRNINGRPIEYVKIDRDLDKLGITKKGKAYPVDSLTIHSWSSHSEKRLVEDGLTKSEATLFRDNAIGMMKKYPVPETQYNYYANEGIIGIRERDGQVNTVIGRDRFESETEKILEVMKKWLK